MDEKNTQDGDVLARVADLIGDDKILPERPSHTFTAQEYAEYSMTIDTSARDRLNRLIREGKVRRFRCRNPHHTGALWVYELVDGARGTKT